MTLKWVEPLSNGGCPLLGYALFRDDGLSSLPIIEVNSSSDPLVRNIPTLTEVTANLNSADLGKKFTYVLRAFNREGQVTSDQVSFLFSTVPSTPSAGPIVTSYSSTKLTAKYLFADSTGGSPIVSYHLQLMLAYSGSWTDVTGSDSLHSLATEHTISGLKKGAVYSLRYRVLNDKGWSQFSLETTITAADVPS